MVLPSDHRIADEPRFREILSVALDAARMGAITAIGIEATRPDTGYGYIELGDTVRPGVRRALRFVEKPDRARAEEYVASGRHVWNGGMFFFRAERLLAAVNEHLPELSAGLARIEAAAREGAARELAETRAVFENLPSVSIDVGVMEKLPGFHVVPAAVGWSDLGSWESAWELSPKDAAGNATPEHGVVLDGARNLLVDLRSGGDRKRVMVALGVEDLCIVETDDALLVMKRDRSQDVRVIVEELRRRKQDDKL
jgi:mannose-1-phosphate guanylyltransferase